MSRSPPNQAPQYEGGDAEAGIYDYVTTRATLGRRIAFASCREVAEGCGVSLLWS